MTDLRQGVSATTHAILDMADSIAATDHVLPEAAKMRNFGAAQRHLDAAADQARSDRYRRAHLNIAASILIVLADDMKAAAEQRQQQLLAKMGYRQ